MGHKHLHELLREDQEPFQLKNYIADRRRLLKTATTTNAQGTALELRKRKPLIQSASATTTARSFCINHVCLFSFHDSPDVRKSPFLDFPSPAINCPCNGKSPNNATVFLHIPSRTAAMLLDAALRVQKQSTSKLKPESLRNAGFGLFGSFLKRLKDRSTRIKRREISSSSPSTRRNRRKDAELDVTRSACSLKNSRLTNADWSEKLSDLETSCSSWSVHDSEEIEFEGGNNAFGSTEKCFCSSPSGPFRFALQKSPSSVRRTPDFLSPATSPTHRLQEEKEDCETENPQEVHVEEEKEQCSPVSVLDPPFEDDKQDHDNGAMPEDGYGLECSYENLQRAKHQLLQKLRRFEKLAELDPIELEKLMSKQRDEDIEEEATNEVVLREILNRLGVTKIPSHMERLVSDLVAEENKNEPAEHELVETRVCRRLEWWKMVESNTIDMMVELDFRRERNEGWRRYDEEEIRATGRDIEVAIFGLLMEELALELVAVYGG